MAGHGSTGKTAVVVGFLGTVAASLATLMQLDYLAPLAPQIASRYWPWILAYLSLVFLHLTALWTLAVRRFEFQQSGLRLGHLEREIRTGEAPYAAEFQKEFGGLK